MPAKPVSRQPAWKQAIVAGVALALVTMAFFWQVLFTPNTWMPAGGGDLVPFLYPNYAFAAQSLKAGTLPLWNPHLYSGLPFAADAQSGLFYPVNLLAFLLLPQISVRSLEYLAIFHFWLAGFGMFLYLQHSPLARRLGLHPVAAFAGAIAFEFSDLFIIHFGNLNMIAVAAWLPPVLLAFQLALEHRSAGLAMLSGALLGLGTLAGHIQITLFILLAIGLAALWKIVGELTTPVANTASRHASRITYHASRITPHVLLLALMVGVTVGVSALWLIPTLEMSRYTPRAALSYAETTAYSLHPAQLIGLLVPNYFGRDPAIHWGPWERVETGYIGILTLLLALSAAVLQKDRHTRFLLLPAGVSFLLALGDSAILHGWLSLSPGFGQFRAPARYIFLLDFSLAGLAAVGLHRLMMPLSTKAHARFAAMLKPLTWVLGGLTVIALPLAYFALLITQDRHIDIFRRAQAAATGTATFAVLVAIGLIVLHLVKAGRLKGMALGLSALVIIGLDVFSLGASVDVGHTNPTTGFNHPAALEYLQQNAGINRIEVTTDVWHLWQPDTALLFGLYDAWGLYNPLTLADTTRYWGQVWPRSSASYNLLGVKYIIAGKAGPPADGDIVPVFDADPDINIYLNRGALPRALFVTHATVVGSHGAAWDAIHSPDFDPLTTVILEAGPGLPKTTSPPPAEPPAYDMALLRYEPHTVEISVTAPSAGYLFLSDAVYPGWQATVDGHPATVHRANYAFRAVAVPVGTHTVQFKFRPASWTIGLSLTLLTLAGLLGFWGWRTVSASIASAADASRALRRPARR